MTHHPIPALRIQKALQAETLPAYLLLGPDLYLRQYVIDAFVARLDPGLRDFNLDRFGEDELQACLDTVRTLPMTSPQRLVILDDVSKVRDADWETLYTYLENPNARTILVLVAQKLHQARVNRIARTAVVISAAEPDFADVRSMAEKSFRKDGFSLETGVIDELLNQVGTSMQALAQEVEKLKLYKLQDKAISVDDVTALASVVRPYEIWAMTDQIATGNRRELLLLLHRMIDGGVIPLVLLKSIYNHFAGLLVVKELLDKRADKPRRGAAAVTQGDIARSTGMKPYHVRRLIGQSQRFKLAELKSALQELHRTDSAIKGSGLADKLLLELLLIRIITRDR